MKLARKLTLALLVGVFVSFMGFYYVRRTRAIEFYDEAIMRDHRLLAHALGAAIEQSSKAGHETEALDFIQRMSEPRLHPVPSDRAQRVGVRWVSLERNPPEIRRPKLDPELLEPLLGGKDDVQQVDASGTVLYSYVAVGGPGQAPGAVELVETLSLEERLYSPSSVLHLVVAIGAVAVFEALVVFGLGAWLVGRPVANLIDVARRIGAGDLSSRADVRQRDELGELGREMNAMAERLAGALDQIRRVDRLATIGKLSAGVAHELGTPLNVILLKAKRLRTGASSPEDISESSRIVIDQAERMTKIIRQLLDLSRPRPPVKAPTDLRALARSTLAVLEPLATKRAVTLGVADGAPARASIDADQIQQVLTNLVMNGVQAMPRGGKLSVGLSSVQARSPMTPGAKETRCLRIDVRDEGEGVAPEVLKHIFEPFVTTKDVGEGTGLGLSVAHGIVREHGGWIAVETARGRGSCFSVYLPQEEVSPCADAS